MGRGSFERLSGVARRNSPDDAEWRQVRYMIFEPPSAAGSFRERAKSIRQIVRQANVSWLREIEQFSLGAVHSTRFVFTSWNLDVEHGSANVG